MRPKWFLFWALGAPWIAAYLFWTLVAPDLIARMVR